MIDPKFGDYCVPLDRDLTPFEHAEHLDAHAALADHLQGDQPGQPARYHLANAKTFRFAAAAIRSTWTFGRVKDLITELTGRIQKAQDQDVDLVPPVTLFVTRTIGLHQRVFDLLRQMRHHLMEEQLISREEYTWLVSAAPFFEQGDPDVPGQGSKAVRRLEAYDDHEARMKNMRTQVARAIATCPHCGPKPDIPPCSQCQQLRAIVRDAIKPGGQ